jgi:glycosyltransferase involved in cell wall biosynthesis
LSGKDTTPSPTKPQVGSRLTRPVRIADQAWPDGTIPVVSIYSLAYNHESFIRDCLEGFLMQETTFRVEILIHDDASTDNTANIIRAYEARYPHLIKPIYQTENQYSKGTGDFSKRNLERARGQYIAICEGDDYWTDASKLQQQVDFLDHNPDYVICYHDAKIVDQFGNVVADSKLPKEWKRDFSSEELMKGAWTLNLSRVARIISRNAEKEAPVKPIRVLNSDIFWTVQLGKYGKGKYLPEIRPAVYRLQPASIWSSLDRDTQNFENFNSFIFIYQHHLRSTGKEFAVEFLFERVFPIFAELFPERNPFCAELRKREMAEQRLLDSYTYRVGALMLWPLKKARQLWWAIKNKVGVLLKR